MSIFEYFVDYNEIIRDIFISVCSVLMLMGDLIDLHIINSDRPLLDISCPHTEINSDD